MTDKEHPGASTTLRVVFLNNDHDPMSFQDLRPALRKRGLTDRQAIETIRGIREGRYPGFGYSKEMNRRWYHETGDEVKLPRGFSPLYTEAVERIAMSRTLESPFSPHIRLPSSILDRGRLGDAIDEMSVILRRTRSSLVEEYRKKGVGSLPWDYAGLKRGMKIARGTLKESLIPFVREMTQILPDEAYELSKELQIHHNRAVRGLEGSA